MKSDHQAGDKPITLLIADDHPIYRDGLQALIGHWDDFQISGVASNGLEALKLYRQFRPDIVLMDVHMPIMSGAEATCLILEEFPSARIVILAISNHDPELFAALEFGACGYALKEVTAQQLHHLLRGWAARDNRYKEEKPTG